jgi:hypothetical protein
MIILNVIGTLRTGQRQLNLKIIKYFMLAARFVIPVSDVYLAKQEKSSWLDTCAF